MLSVETLFQEARLKTRVRSLTRVLADEDAAKIIARQIGLLPETHRIALALRFYEALAPEEIACVLGLKEEKLRGLLREATEMLAEGLRNTVQGGESGASTTRRNRGRKR